MAHTSIPEGWHSVTPRLVVHGAQELVSFLRRVFLAEGEFHADRPSTLRIGNSLVMVSDAAARGAAMPACLYVYVDDVDAVFERARRAGSRTIEAPRELHYGDRRAMVEDPFGNQWQIATHTEDVSPEEAHRRLAAARRT